MKIEYVWAPLALAFLPFLQTSPSAGDSPFGDGRAIGTVVSGEIAEASGLAASRANPAVLWVHNDSGQRAQVFALGMDGTIRATYNLVDVDAVDFEDMAIGPGPAPGAHYLYVGDIGDNLATRTSIVVYRAPEPNPTASSEEIDITEITALEMRYPDGPHDAEALMSDPLSGDLFIITKDNAGANKVYRAASPHSHRLPSVLEEIATIRFPGAGASDLAATGADISKSGTQILVRSYNRALLWPRKPDQTVAQALAGASQEVPVPGPPTEPQGEAIAFSLDESSYFTLGEGLAQPLYRFDRRPPPQ